MFTLNNDQQVHNQQRLIIKKWTSVKVNIKRTTSYFTQLFINIYFNGYYRSNNGDLL